MKRPYLREQFGDAKDLYGVYTDTLVELAKTNRNIVLLYADFVPGSAGEFFKKEYPDQIYDFGIAEANMITIAGGMAAAGKMPFTHCHAIFAVGRGYNQIRQSVAFDKWNVKIVLLAPGIFYALMGASHQIIEDIAALRAIPNLMLVSPADAVETRELTKAIAEYVGPVAIRLTRPLVPMAVPTIYKDNYTSFTLGKSVTLVDGQDATIVATGILLADCVKACDILTKEGISTRLLDMHTIKPLDEQAIIKAAKETGALVTVEDSNIIGGLGAAVAEVISEHQPVPMQRVGVKDRFGQTGNVEELKIEYELSSGHIAGAVREVINRKIKAL